MNYYKTRQDDQMLREAYASIINEGPLGKTAAALGTAAALATAGCDGPNCKPKTKKGDSKEEIRKMMRSIGVESSMADMEYKSAISKATNSKEFTLVYYVPVKNGKPMLPLDKLNAIRRQCGLSLISNDQYMAASNAANH